MDHKLLPDIWLLIASRLDSADLSRLGRSSRHLLELLRPVLFKTTILPYGINYSIPGQPTTLKLLSRDPDLARSVKQFRYSEKIFNNLRAIFNMTTVLDLEIGVHFHSEQEQQELVDYFRMREVPLEELKMRDAHFESDNFEITGLKNLEWHLSAASPLLSVLNASRETLTRIQLSSEAIKSGDPADSFWSMRFPQLHTFCLSYLDEDALTGGNDREEFFIAHAATLQEIIIGKFGLMRDVRFAFFTPQTNPSPGSNRLTFRFLAARISDLVHLSMKYGPNAFAGLVRLEIIASEFPSFDSFADLYVLRNEYGLQNQHVRQRHPFPNLRELSMPFWSEHHSPEEGREITHTATHFSYWLEQCTEFFGPSVEVLSGCLPPIGGMTAEALGRALSRFPKLKRIVISDLAVGGFDGAEAYVLELAISCVSLEVVDIKDTADNIKSGLTLEIGREGQSKLIPRIIRKKWVKNFHRGFDISLLDEVEWYPSQRRQNSPLGRHT